MRISVLSLLLFFSFAFCQNSSAQNQTPSLEELQQRMLELQRQMMQQFQNSPFNDPGFAMPQWDTTFYFHFDTTFEGGNMSHFFQFSPFGGDSTLRGNFRGFEHFFEPFFDSENLFGEPDSTQDPFPADDGNQPKTEDDLLPEERLRREQNGEKPVKKTAPRAQPAEPKPDPKIKTIRI
ncbi:MAG: hypothetical protein IPJ82_04850 [Lewinellaceae bacterium]|nr:hypothetical protein [Lewinellaceae bacterium]